MTKRYAHRTPVTEESSRREIERTLARYGADAIALGFDDNSLHVRFRWRGRFLQRTVTVPPLATFLPTYGSMARDRKLAQTAREAERRRLWRVLLLWLKTTFELVEAEAVTPEEAFLPVLMLPSGQTVAEWLAPQLTAAYERGEMPKLLLPGREGQRG